MASSFTMFNNYQRLRKLPTTNTDDDDDDDDDDDEEEEHVTGDIVQCRRPRRRWRWVRIRRVWWRRGGIRIAGLGSLVRRAVRKVVERVKEGRSYCFGDLFAGNYMFMQVTPAYPANVHKYYCNNRLKYKLPSRINIS